MLNFNAVRKSIQQRFDVFEDLGDGIFRGERRYHDKPFVVAYIDLNDDVVARAQNLTKFQESLLGSTFFTSGNDLRWNSYLYFLAGPKSMRDKGYLKAKEIIESDRHFARKFVLSEEDLSLQLRAAPGEKPNKPNAQWDAGAIWSDLVRTGQLGVLLKQGPRTKALNLIATGAAFKVETKSAAPRVVEQSDPLQQGFLRSFTIGRFRPVNSGKSFKFGDVNLIFGTNGTGKTSLLEAIEAFYCGRIRRAPDAGFSGLKAEVESPTGKRDTVLGIIDPATLKARNLRWYGRPDFQSNAISQGFTRFNFLDTDAAFRLSSDLDPEEIRQDIDKLLVGAETSKLWNYLSRLEEEVRVKIKELNDRMPVLQRQSELLAAEVKRLRELPSNASALAKSYRASLVELKVNWLTDSFDDIIDQANRSRLESLTRNIGLVISVLQDTPVTISKLRVRAKSLLNVLADVRRLASEHSKTVDQLNTDSNVILERQKSIGVLESWLLYCEAGVPALATALQSVKARISPLSSVLSGISAETLPEVPPQYAAILIADALVTVRQNLKKAENDELAATHALAQRKKLGQSLATLRKDLHDTALDIIEKTGDDTACPVCGTLHDPSELLAKMETLLAEENAAKSDGLRRALQSAKESVEKEQKLVELLMSLQNFSKALAPTEAKTCAMLRSALLKMRSEMSQLLEETGRLNAATDALGSSGLDWKNYEPTRDAVRKILTADTIPSDVGNVTQALALQHTILVADLSKADVHRQQVADFMKQIDNKLLAISLSLPEGSSPATVVTMIERATKQVEDALITASSVGDQIAVSDEQSFEVLQRVVDQAIVAFDKALHAADGEVQAQKELIKKSVELGHANASLDKDVKVKENYIKAKTVLSPLVNEHSLEDATKDVLASIREQVSEVFSRIHSPRQYELGDFEDSRFLVTRETKQPHGVDQISTGQRSAFALSIFLALNASAASAPPVVLIDDPIAHIDDLNALSFLDYLRDLVMSSRKQVFFATADARLAALFQRKFEFLGEERFRKIVLSM